MAKRGVFSGPNTEKYEAEKIWYLGIFHAVKATVIFDTSLFAAKVNLYNLKSNADKLDINKLKTVPITLDNLKSRVDTLDGDKIKKILVDLKNLTDLAGKDFVKKPMHDQLVTNC